MHTEASGDGNTLLLTSRYLPRVSAQRRPSRAISRFVSNRRVPTILRVFFDAFQVLRQASALKHHEYSAGYEFLKEFHSFGRTDTQV
jgi:hypothetical protein